MFRGGNCININNDLINAAADVSSGLTTNV